VKTGANSSGRSAATRARILLGIILCACSAREVSATEIAAVAALDAAETEDPAAPHAVGRVFGAGSAGQRSVFVLSSAGYGYRGATVGETDSHHRVGGSISLEKRVTRWLGFALRFDGRYDLHVIPNRPNDYGMVGDPRFYARIDRVLSDGFRVGARLGIWFPGRDAPSIYLAAATPELVVATSYVPTTVPLSVSANLGFRLDRSARSARDAPFISPSDRVALEVSDFDQALLGLSVGFGRGRTQGFVEASQDLLVGQGAPGASISPLRIGGGARMALTSQIRLEVGSEVSPNARPDTSANGPLVPVPPRVALGLGLAYRFDENRPQETRAPAPTLSVPATVELKGQVVAADLATLADLKVEAEEGERKIQPVSDADGRFVITGTVGQTVTLRAGATGYATASTSVALTSGGDNQILLTLERNLPSGQLRGLVRSLAGKPIDADITIEPGAHVIRAQEGEFEVDVAPGSYDVTIVASGYATQTRQVRVETHGVTLLNIDLTGQR
jgi:hypothetical protein